MNSLQQEFYSFTTAHLTKIGFFRSERFRELRIA